MSAAVLDLAPAPAPRPARPRRHLALVPAPVPEAVPVAERGLRLTRRGRRVVGLALATVVAGVAFIGLPGSGATAADHAVTVRAGQTLSEIAVRELPDLPVRTAVAEIQLANNLAGEQVSAGQVIVIPAA